MFAPATALRANQVVFTLFAVAMMFFPSEMMQGYSEFRSCPRHFISLVEMRYPP